MAGSTVPLGVRKKREMLKKGQAGRTVVNVSRHAARVCGVQRGRDRAAHRRLSKKLRMLKKGLGERPRLMCAAGSATAGDRRASPIALRHRVRGYRRRVAHFAGGIGAWRASWS